MRGFRYFTCEHETSVLQYINNLETQEYPKTTLDLENLNFLKKLSSVLKIIR